MTFCLQSYRRGNREARCPRCVAESFGVYAARHAIFVLTLQRVDHPSADKQRPKRPRAHSPLSSTTPPTPVLVATGRNTSAPTQRGSTGPQPSTPLLRGTKVRGDTLRETILKQLPLQEGRMVAFHPPSSGKGADSTSPEDTTWIMARIVRSFHQDKYR